MIGCMMSSCIGHLLDKQAKCELRNGYEQFIHGWNAHPQVGQTLEDCEELILAVRELCYVRIVIAKFVY